MQPINPFPDPQLLDRYLSGFATDQERHDVESWLQENPSQRRRIETLRAALYSPDNPLPDYNLDARVSAILDYSIRAARRNKVSGRSIDELYRQELNDKPLVRLRSYFSHNPAVIAVIAATVIIIAGISLFSIQTAPSLQPAVSTYATGNGERATVTLVDGSRVILNVASRLEVPENYGSGNRALQLTGEALFVVSPKKGSPFTVRAANHTTKVLGTSFVVRRYPTDTATLVAVSEGKVSVESAIITAGEQVVVTRDGESEQMPSNPGRFTFASSILTLDAQSFSSAVVDLERWYNVDIKLGDQSVSDRRISGQFSAGSLTDLKEILEITFGFRVERSGRALTLYSR